jgi:hypothetical protein
MTHVFLLWDHRAASGPPAFVSVHETFGSAVRTAEALFHRENVGDRRPWIGNSNTWRLGYFEVKREELK